MRARATTLFLAAATVALPVAAIAADATQTVTGRVVTEDGTPIARAAVLLYGTGGDRTAVTGADGRFAVPNLAPAAYAVRIDAAGFNVLTGRTSALRATDKIRSRST